MEQLIIFIILAILGSFFNKSKKKAADEGQPKPFTATGRVPDNPKSTLKEMSKDLYREFQKEMHREDVEPPSRQLQQTMIPQPVVVAQPVAAPVTAAPVRSATPRAGTERKERADSSRDRQRERHSGRLSVHGGTRQSNSVIKTHDLMPKNEQDLLKGIVFSEIFGPPKAKR